MLITSLENSRVKFASSLKNVSGRKKQNAFLLEGKKLIEEALKCGYKMKDCFVLESKSTEYMSYIQNGAHTVDERVFGKITETDNPQGIVAVFEVLEIKSDKFDKLVILENIQDPGNFGTVIRTAEAMGIDAVCVVGSAPDRYSGKVMRSAMGAALRMPVIKFKNADDAFEFFDSEKISVYAAVLDDTASPVDKVSFAVKSAVAVGNEGNGLSREFVAKCGKKVYIPMKGVTESLNASAAASILIWEMCK